MHHQYQNWPNSCRDSHFTFFKMAALRHFKKRFFEYLWRPMCISMQNFISIWVKPLLRYSNLSFSRWRSSAILDLWVNFGTTCRVFGCFYHYAKFGWYRSSRFDNTKVWIFCAFGLKTPIHAPFWAVLGINLQNLQCTWMGKTEAFCIFILLGMQ